MPDNKKIDNLSMKTSTLTSLIEYGKFKLDIKELSSFFAILYTNPKAGLVEWKKNTGLGKSKIENLRYYLRDCSLLNHSNFDTTDLAEFIHKNDPRFRDSFTLWLLLYGWSKKENNPFLHYFLNYSTETNPSVNNERLFIEWASKNNFKTDYESTVPGLIKRTVTALTDIDAFQSLNLFTTHDERLYRAEPYNVHPLLLAYILYDNGRGRHSISLPELLDEPGNLGKFFGYDIRALDNRLNDLENLNLVKRVQVANLNMIELLYNGSPLAFIERYYNEY